MDSEREFLSVKRSLQIFLPFSFGYFLSYLFRSVNAVISPNLITEFNLDASQLGLLTSVYFLTFASLQIPIGILLDRYGPRRVNAVLLTVAALGAFIFFYRCPCRKYKSNPLKDFPIKTNKKPSNGICSIHVRRDHENQVPSVAGAYVRAIGACESIYQRIPL